MIWGYLTEFWDAITDVVVGGITYTTEWFQGIGNAVAGAIGALFEDLIHHLYDVFYIGQYLVDNLANLFAIIFTPLTWTFNFVKGFFVSAFAPPVEPAINWVFSEQILSVFDKIPYWDIFTLAIGAGIAILTLVFIFRRLTSF